MPVRAGARARLALAAVVAAVIPLATSSVPLPAAPAPAGTWGSAAPADPARAAGHGSRVTRGTGPAGQAAAALPLPGGSASRAGSARWMASWAAGLMPATPAGLAGPGDFSRAGFTRQTIRDVVWASAGGPAARVRLANTFGTRPVTFNRVGLGISARGASLARGTSHRVTFGGHRSVTIAPGRQAVSDPVPLTVAAGADLAVSLFTRGPTGPVTFHGGAERMSYVAAGDHTGSARARSFRVRSPHWYFLAGVDVRARPGTPAGIVAVGDSITEGDGSSFGTSQGWPEDLARRMQAGAPGQAHPVVDEGIGGNRVLSDSPCFGPSALSRFNRDARQAGARYAILLEGINDIGFAHDASYPCAGPAADPSALQIIAGYRYLIAAAHAAGLKIFGATLTPFGGAHSWSRAGEAKREAVNRWIRTGGAFDGVIDFDKAVRDPAAPLRLLPAYDSGDHLHPDDAGYRAMANAVNLGLFRP